jgi:hypothetical protein
MITSNASDIQEGGLSIVYVNGMAKVYDGKGEEIKMITNVIVNHTPNKNNTVQIEALCSVYGTVEEMKKELGLTELTHEDWRIK